jgi:hypothetical protein
MRPRLLLGLLLVAALPVRAQMKVITTSKVRDVCRTVDTACTNFDDTELYCACFLKGNVWKPTAKIKSNPVVYLSDRKYMLHELSHLYDFDRAMRNYERLLEGESFQSFNACEKFAGNARVTFADFLRDVQYESMRMRDHIAVLSAARLPDGHP